MSVAEIDPFTKRRNGISEAEWQARVDLAALFRIIAHYGMSKCVGARMDGWSYAWRMRWRTGLTQQAVPKRGLCSINGCARHPMLVLTAGNRAALLHPFSATIHGNQ